MRNPMPSHDHSTEGEATSMPTSSSAPSMEKGDSMDGKTNITTTTNNTVSSSLAMRVQRKVLSKLSKRGMVRILANNRIIALMDILYALLKEFYEQLTAEKVVKNGIKLIFKIGFLERDNKLNEAQLHLLDEFERELRQLALTIQSFSKVQFTYDLTYLHNIMDRLHRNMLTLVTQTLSDKSTKRLEHVFEHLSDGKFLDTVFTSTTGAYAQLVQKFADEIESLVFNDSDENAH